MPGRHPIACCLWPAVWLCLGVAAQAQPAAPVDAAQAAAAMARGIAATVLAPATALGAGEAGMSLGGAAPGGRPMVVAVPGTAMPGTTTPGAATPGAAGSDQAGHAQAMPPAQPPAPHVQGLTLEAGTGRIVSLDTPAASVFAADPRVAEVRPASPTSLFVLGMAPGRTTVAAIGDNGAAIAQYDVIVQGSSYAAAQAATAIGKLLPGRDVQVVARPNGLLVSGTNNTTNE